MSLSGGSSERSPTEPVETYEGSMLWGACTGSWEDSLLWGYRAVSLVERILPLSYVVVLWCGSPHSRMFIEL